MANKRKDERMECLVPVEDKKGGAFEEAAALDLSQGGLGFISSKEIPLHKEVTIALDLGMEKDPVFVVGKVKWVKPVLDSENFRVGMSFKNFLKGSKQELGRWFDEPH